MKKVYNIKKGIALLTASALIISGITTPAVKAAPKTPSLSESDITIQKGKSKTITIKKGKKVTIKKVTWKIESGKKAVKITSSSKKKITIKATKKGNAVISAKIKVGKKVYKRKLYIKVKDKKKVTPSPKPTNAVKTEVPVVTKTPAAASDTPAVKTDTPVSSVPPIAPTAVPTTAPTVAPTATPTTAPTDTPSATPTAKPTDTPSATPAATATEAPSNNYVGTATEDTDDLGGYEMSRSGWNKGQINLLPEFAGKKMKFSFYVREVGKDIPENKKIDLKSNYNGYPTLTSFPLTKDWTKVEFEYRFNTFTNNNAVMYVDDSFLDGACLYIKDYSTEVIDGVDPLGGTVLPKASWHKGVLGSFVKADHENKQVKISFKLREKGVENPTGTCEVQSNYPGDDTTYPKLKTDVPLTTDWTEVSIETTVGTIGNQYPSIYLNGDAITNDMEMFVDEFKIEVIGDAPATPTPEVTPEPEETPEPEDTSTETITVNKTATIPAGKDAYDGYIDVALDNTVTILETDTVKAKIKVCYDGETDEQTSYNIQFGFYTGDNTWNTRCFITSGLKSGTETLLDRGDSDTGELTVKGFKVQNEKAVPAGKDLKVTLEEIIITHTESAEEVSDDYTMEFSSWVDGMATYRGYSSIGVDTTDGYFWYEYGGSGDKQWESGYYGYPVIKVTLPTGKTLADYDSISLDYKALVGDANYKTVNLYIVKESKHATESSKPSISAGAVATEAATESWKTLSGFSIATDKVAADLSDLTANTFWVAIDPNCGNEAKEEYNNKQTKFGIDNLTFHAKSAD